MHGALSNPVCNWLSEMLHVYKSEARVAVAVMTAKTLASIQRLKIVELFGRKVACENSRPSSLPARVAFHGCFRGLKGKRKVAFHTITDFTLLHVLSRNFK